MALKAAAPSATCDARKPSRPLARKARDANYRKVPCAASMGLSWHKAFGLESSDNGGAGADALAVPNYGFIG